MQIKIQEAWIRIWIATKLPSFQSPAAAEALLRTPVMKEPYLYIVVVN